MATTQKTHLLYLLITLLTVTTHSISTNPPSVYELLPKFGLPSGLLPDNVKSYSLSEDGSFVVELEKPCYIDFDYKVYYDKKITGILKYGSISNLDGIQVQRFFLWLRVDEIKVDLPPSDNIYFQVGFINKKLDVGQFETVHACGDKVTRAGSDHQSWKRVLQKLFNCATPQAHCRLHITTTTVASSGQNLDIIILSRILEMIAGDWRVFGGVWRRLEATGVDRRVFRLYILLNGPVFGIGLFCFLDFQTSRTTGRPSRPD